MPVSHRDLPKSFLIIGFQAIRQIKGEQHSGHSGLSIPIPKAFVATITETFPFIHKS